MLERCIPRFFKKDATICKNGNVSSPLSSNQEKTRALLDCTQIVAKATINSYVQVLVCARHMSGKLDRNWKPVAG